jgi:hypothetical protein
VAISRAARIGKHLGMFTDQVQVRARYAISDEPTSAEQFWMRCTTSLISRGPPTGSGIPFEASRSWHRYGFIVCPASKVVSCPGQYSKPNGNFPL